MSATSITNLRAEVAMRAEDTRIARRHETQAAARDWSPANEHAWQGAVTWTEICAEAERVARAALIAAMAVAA